MSWNNQRTEIAIGVDTGVKTGFAIWNKTKKCFDEISTMTITKALFKVKQLHDKGVKMIVVVEDARQARFGRNTATDRHKLQGAGSVKRDAKIWQDFLTENDIPHVMVRPQKKITKMNKEQFTNQTGYTGSTSEHSRDAAMLVWQY